MKLSCRKKLQVFVTFSRVHGIKQKLESNNHTFKRVKDALQIFLGGFYE